MINSSYNFKVSIGTCAEMFQNYQSFAFALMKRKNYFFFYKIMAFSNLESFQVLITTG